MYLNKELVYGYNPYLKIDENNGAGTMMDVGVLMMKEGDVYKFNETEKELAWIILCGNITLNYSGGTVNINRPNPFDYNPWCLHLPAGESCEIKAHGHTEIYVQKTYNDKFFSARLYRPKDTDTWRLGSNGELGGCIERDVRTCFDYENAPYSNMVLGEVVNLAGKWSSYPPHDHPQPEVYYYHFEKPQGFGAGWANGKVYEIHHHGLLVITEGTHSQVMAPGYPCCYVWGIRHLPGNPWKKTRIDDPVHEWLLDLNAKYWDNK